MHKHELKICLVGELTKEKEFRLWGFDEGLGWVPHINLHTTNTELRIARIPTDWYGEHNTELQYE